MDIMTRISKTVIQRFVDDSRTARNSTERGRILVNLAVYIFEKIPGLSAPDKEQFNITRTQEIDIALWNDCKPEGLSFLPSLILVECKNWSNAVDGQSVSWFIQKIRERGLTHGIIIAKNDITGNLEKHNGAYEQVISARREGIRIIIFTGEEIESITDSNQLVELFKKKICQLVVA